MLGRHECVRTGCGCFVVVRRIYIIIIVRRVVSFLFVDLCWGCGQLSESTVVYGFFFRSSYESCDAVFPAVVWGSSIAGCVVWVRVICWLVWGIVFRVRHKSGFSRIIFFLHL